MPSVFPTSKPPGSNSSRTAGSREKNLKSAAAVNGSSISTIRTTPASNLWNSRPCKNLAARNIQVGIRVSILDAVSQESYFMQESGLIPMSRLILAVFLVCMPLAAQRNPPRPKIHSIAFVRFKAVDFEKSNAFYAKILGLKPGSDNCKGFSSPCFAINPYQHVELTQAGSRARGSYLEVVGFNVSDVAQMKAFLDAKGVASTGITRGPNGLRYIEAPDPEGNRLAFVELSGNDSQTNGLRQISNRMLHA